MGESRKRPAASGPAGGAERRPVANCRDAIDLLTEYMEGGLSAAERREFEAHLSLCPACVEYLETVKKTVAAAPNLRSREVPEECRRQLRDLLDRTVSRSRARRRT